MAPGSALGDTDVRMVLCESGLASREGHHFNMVVGVRAELARRGVPLTVLSNVAVAPELCAELDAIPLFELDPYSSLVALTRDRQIQSWLRAGSKFTAALRRTEIRSGDVVLVFTARPAELLGLAGWSWTRWRLPRAIVLNFMTDDSLPARTFTPPGLVRVLYRFGATLLRLRVGRQRLVLTCASELLAASLERQVHHDVIVSPELISYPAEPVRGRGTEVGSDPAERTRQGGTEVGSDPAEPARQDSGNLTIGFLGTPRHDKGGDLLTSVIEGCAFWLPDARVVVQWPWYLRGPPQGWPDNVHPVPVGLDQHRYLDLLQELDLVVLPYRTDAFGDMTSGVFTEAVGYGAVTVVPAKSWMATMIQRGRAAGVAFEEFNVTGIVGAIAIAATNIDQLRRQAATLQAPWRAEQSISSYFDQLMGELERRGALGPG